jgi:hypothetical protein
MMTVKERRWSGRQFECNIGSEHEAASPVPDIVPAPIQAPEGASVGDVKMQNSTLRPCGNVVLKTN